MFDSRLTDLLAQPAIVRVSTISSDGYPHTTPVWFLLDGETLILFTGREARKARNVRTNAKGAIAIGGDPVDSPCYLIQGDFTIEDDPDHSVTARITYHYEPPEKAAEWLSSWEGDDHVILRLTPNRIVQIS